MNGKPLFCDVILLLYIGFNFILNNGYTVKYTVKFAMFVTVRDYFKIHCINQQLAAVKSKVFLQTSSRNVSQLQIPIAT